MRSRFRSRTQPYPCWPLGATDKVKDHEENKDRQPASASKHRLNFIDRLPLTVTIADQATRTAFVVIEELGADFILVWQYIDAAVHEINVKRLALVLKSGARVPIQRLCARYQSAVPLLEWHQLKQRVKKSLDFVRVVKTTVIPMNTEAYVEVDCLRSGTLVLEQADELYTRRKTVMPEDLQR